MIVVTGATGKLGSQIVSGLLRRVPAAQIGVSVRDTGQVGDLAEIGVRVRRGDYTDPASLAAAFEDATQVLIISASVTGEEGITHHRNAIDAARTAGAEHILYTSHQAASADSLFAPMLDHAATERHLAQTATPYTALRNGFYASTVPRLLGDAVNTGQLIAPADGPVSWTAHADLAEAAAVLLTDPGRLDGPTPPLTAPDALDLADVAELLTDLTGRPIERVVAADDDWLAGLTSHGVPQPQAEMLLGMFHASRVNEFNDTGPTLAELLDRPATPLRHLLQGTFAR